MHTRRAIIAIAAALCAILYRYETSLSCTTDGANSSSASSSSPFVYFHYDDLVIRTAPVTSVPDLSWKEKIVSLNEARHAIDALKGQGYSFTTAKFAAGTAPTNTSPSSQTMQSSPQIGPNDPRKITAILSTPFACYHTKGSLTCVYAKKDDKYVSHLETDMTTRTLSKAAFFRQAEFTVIPPSQPISAIQRLSSYLHETSHWYYDLVLCFLGYQIIMGCGMEISFYSTGALFFLATSIIRKIKQSLHQKPIETRKFNDIPEDSDADISIHPEIFPVDPLTIEADVPFCSSPKSPRNKTVNVRASGMPSSDIFNAATPFFSSEHPLNGQHTDDDALNNGHGHSDHADNSISGNVHPVNDISGNGIFDNGISGNVHAVNDISGNGISGNGISGNDISDNDISGNEISGNEISDNGISDNGASGNGIADNGTSDHDHADNCISDHDHADNGISDHDHADNDHADNEHGNNGISDNESDSTDDELHLKSLFNLSISLSHHDIQSSRSPCDVPHSGNVILDDDFHACHETAVPMILLDLNDSVQNVVPSTEADRLAALNELPHFEAMTESSTEADFLAVLNELPRFEAVAESCTEIDTLAVLKELPSFEAMTEDPALSEMSTCATVHMAAEIDTERQSEIPENNENSHSLIDMTLPPPMEFSVDLEEDSNVDENAVPQSMREVWGDAIIDESFVWVEAPDNLDTRPVEFTSIPDVLNELAETRLVIPVLIEQSSEATIISAIIEMERKVRALESQLRRIASAMKVQGGAILALKYRSSVLAATFGNSQLKHLIYLFHQINPSDGKSRQLTPEEIEMVSQFIETVKGDQGDLSHIPVRLTTTNNKDIPEYYYECSCVEEHMFKFDEAWENVFYHITKMEFAECVEASDSFHQYLDHWVGVCSPKQTKSRQRHLYEMWKTWETNLRRVNEFIPFAWHSVMFLFEASRELQATYEQYIKDVTPIAEHSSRLQHLYNEENFIKHLSQIDPSGQLEQLFDGLKLNCDCA